MVEITKRYIIEGRVQGVFYRAATKKQAELLGVCGYVRNLPEGQVEVVATGNPARLARLCDWLWQGPPNARVVRVIEQDTTLEAFTAFGIKS